TYNRVSSAASRQTTRRACFRSPPPSRSRRADCADPRRPSTPWDRQVRSKGRDHHCSSAPAQPRGRQRLPRLREAVSADSDLMQYLSSDIVSVVPPIERAGFVLSNERLEEPKCYASLSGRATG